MGQAASTENSLNKPNIQTQTQVKPTSEQSYGNVPKYEFVGGGIQIPQNFPSQLPTGQISQKYKYKATLNSNDLLEAFRIFSIERKYLNQTRFNDAIEYLFNKVDIPSMHYTCLSEKIYALLDQSRDGKINEEEYLNGMKNVIVNREFRLKLSMMAMMPRPEERNFIEFKEIVDFFFKSWVYGYKHLGWQIKKDKNEFVTKGLPAPTITQFELWASKFENHIRIYLTNDFRECGLDINRPLDFDTFKKWLSRDHSLKLSFAWKNVTIATSLIFLDEIGFDDSLIQPQGFSPINPQQIGYPSFK